MKTIDEIIIHGYYETIPNGIEKSPEDFKQFLDSLKDSLNDTSWESNIKYLVVLREYHRLFGIQYTASDLEFIINNLESTITDWNVRYKPDIETLIEVIETYEGFFSDELNRKYDRIKDKFRTLN